MSHFFSLVRLHHGAAMRRETRDVLRSLSRAGDAYRDHCLLLKLFPTLRQQWESTSRDERSTDFVFRLRSGTGMDEDNLDGVQAQRASRSPSWYVVSREQPVPVLDLLAVKTQIFTPQLRRGDSIRFQLRANPSVTQARASSSESQKKSRRPHQDVLMLAKSAAATNDRIDAMQTAGAEWLLRREDRLGLRMDRSSLFVDGYAQHRIERGNDRGTRAIRFSSIDYTGFAEVTDPALAAQAMLEGVGRKRGFGCGLLLVRRLH